MKLKTVLLTIAAVVGMAVTSVSFSSCKELDDLDGMNNHNFPYYYRAQSTDYDYSEAVGKFDTAIKFSVGLDPIPGGADDEVIEACTKCYEELKPKLGKGIVRILKIRHSDGKEKVLTLYIFG